ncbi:MAG: rhodanese-like domain-containing protein [Ilumatobacter sp.]|uniref:rhodanese-like domain-containing protein n=1 Tax=Ilumatobacter sp. TaxID=1967498 RepID=UPI00260BF19C|nr:rhodanese-like domain-containing protein [Ilumatobacter sp.]MDJ0768921.1 rhodanese-like domain-containing protein [Ilumatobacter sp.]
MTRTLLRAAAPVVTVALLLAACGDSDEDTAEAVDVADPPAAAVEDATDDATDAVTDDAAAVPAVDVATEVDSVMAGLPEGWLALKTVEDFDTAVTQTSPLVIDVREVSDYEAGHIPGAVNIPIRSLADHVDEIPMDQPVVVYCASGYRAAMSTIALRSLGYDNVRAFGGSYKAWTAAEREVSTDPVALPAGTAKDIAPEMLLAVSNFLVPMPEGYLNIGEIETMQGAIDAGAYVVDVRETGEFAEGHIPGAVNVPLRTLMDGGPDFPTDRQVVVYCKSGYRAAMANAALGVAGWDNIQAFAPSWNAWTEAGLEVEL